jgi:DNA-directed RNA polymerase subunit M/transcription elongation factor TFIIS
MEVDKQIRDSYRKKYEQKFNAVISSKIENGILKFSQEYAIKEETPYLCEEIYKTKALEILDLLKNTTLIKNIENGKLDPFTLAYMKPEILDPEKFKTLLDSREKEKKKNDNAGTNVFKCKKCKKSRSKVTQKQTRAADEAPTTFVECLECGHTFRID